MKILSRIVQSLLLVTTPALAAYPTNESSRLVVEIPDLRTLSYDEVVDLLSEIESDSFNERCSMDELDQINQFIRLTAGKPSPLGLGGTAAPPF